MKLRVSPHRTSSARRFVIGGRNNSVESDDTRRADHTDIIRGLERILSFQQGCYWCMGGLLQNGFEPKGLDILPASADVVRMTDERNLQMQTVIKLIIICIAFKVCRASTTILFQRTRTTILISASSNFRIIVAYSEWDTELAIEGLTKHVDSCGRVSQTHRPPRSRCLPYLGKFAWLHNQAVFFGQLWKGIFCINRVIYLSLLGKYKQGQNSNSRSSTQPRAGGDSSVSWKHAWVS